MGHAATPPYSKCQRRLHILYYVAGHPECCTPSPRLHETISARHVTHALDTLRPSPSAFIWSNPSCSSCVRRMTQKLCGPKPRARYDISRCSCRSAETTDWKTRARSAKGTRNGACLRRWG